MSGDGICGCGHHPMSCCCGDVKPAENYRKRPVVISALRLPVGLFDKPVPRGDRTVLEYFIGKPHGAGGYAEGRHWSFGGNKITIHTLEGDMEAREGDYIIKGIKGEFYPCAPDIFEATYEPVDGEERRGLHLSVPDQADDAVNHPSHYTSHPSGVECIEITRHMGFNVGNALKYLWRAGQKDPDKEIEDLQKAVWYLNDEIEKLRDA